MRNMFLQIQRLSRRFHSSSAGAGSKVTRYARGISIYHWAMAGGVLGCFGTVNLARNTAKGDPRKGTLMKYHKSVGLLMGALVAGRLARRFVFVDRARHIPGYLPGPWALHKAGDLAHLAMYGLMVFMPVTGITMGYFGGKGLPFFGAHIPGKAEPNKAVAFNAYKAHKLVGKAFEATVALHVSGALFHVAQGHRPLARINPFASGSAGIAAFLFESIEDGYVVDRDAGSDAEMELLLGDEGIGGDEEKNGNNRSGYDEGWTKDLNSKEKAGEE